MSSTLRAREVSDTTRNFGTTPPKLPMIDTFAGGADYDRRIAYLTAVVSGWAYSDAETMTSQLPYYGLAGCTVHEFRVTNPAMLIVAAAYFVRSANGRVGVLCFRGTVPDDIVNWLTDANTTPRAFQFGQVHTGFFENVQPLWSDIVDTIENAMAAGASNRSVEGAAQLEPLQYLYITGHSLGAAMAVIAAARIFTNDYAHWQELIRGVYTYGQPAVGDLVFAQHYEKAFNLYRHVYRSDLVPRMPPRTVGKFVHFGQEFYANQGSGWLNEIPARVKPAAFLLLTATAATFDYVSRRIVLLRRLKLPYSLEDHGPEGYIDASRRSL